MAPPVRVAYPPGGSPSSAVATSAWSWRPALPTLATRSSASTGIAQLVDGLGRGVLRVQEDGLPQLIAEGVAAERLRFTTEYEEGIPEAEFVFLAVDTPQTLGGASDLRNLRAAAHSVAGSLNGVGPIVVNKSTSPIGTGDMLETILWRETRDDQTPPVIVSNPEFLQQGRAVQDFFEPSRIVVGAADQADARKVADLYRGLPGEVVLTSRRTAEMIKYVANTFLATRISFINEVAQLCEAMGVDVDEVVTGVAQDDRIGSHFFRPGIGYGGSCLPKDTASLRFMGEATGVPTPFLGAVQQVNEHARTRTVRRLREALGTLERKRIGVWGLTFKGDTEDTRQSPATEVVQLLANEGAEVVAFDPSRPSREMLPPRLQVELAPDALAAVDDVDALVVLTDWREFARGPARRGRGTDARRPGARWPEPARPRRRPARRPALPGRGSRTAAPGRGSAPGRRGARVKVLVAGGAGFIGSHLSRALLKAGHHVYVVDDFSTGSHDNISDLMAHPSFELVQADVCVTPTLPVDVIAHLASPASPIDYDRMPVHTMRANSLGTYRLLDVANEVGASLLFASTSEVYGDPLVHPQPESYWGNVDPIGPRSCYDEGKRFSEALVFATRRETGVRANIVRFFNTYGPDMRRDDGRVIPEMVSAALADRPLTVHGDGSQTRSFCYVSDLVRGLMHVLLDPDLDGEVFNIGNPHEITVRELAQHITELAGNGQDALVHQRPTGRSGATTTGHRQGRRPLRLAAGGAACAMGWQLTIEAFRDAHARGRRAGQRA